YTVRAESNGGGDVTSLFGPESTEQNQELIIPNGFFTNNNTEWNNTEWREPDEENKENEGIDKADYQNSGSQLRTALDKLCSFLYDLNRDLDPTARVKSESMIRVQVESIKRRKSETSGGGKRKLPATISKGKEILEPQVIPARKKRKTSKKDHNLSKNI
ncbi:14032_t:CDS:2, partial [Funneliformis mosseae]